MYRISIFASGSGSNAENLVRYFMYHADIVVDSIVSNVADAYVLERAKKLDVETFVFSRKDFRAGEKVLQLMEERKVDLIVLAGFLQLIPEVLVKRFPLINIHPALLPKHGGKGMYGMRVHQAVKESGDKESGITIHLIDEKYDEGEILFQKTCPVLDDDSPEDIANKVHQLEYEFFPKVVENYLLRND